MSFAITEGTSQILGPDGRPVASMQIGTTERDALATLAYGQGPSGPVPLAVDAAGVQTPGVSYRRDIITVASLTPNAQGLVPYYDIPGACGTPGLLGDIFFGVSAPGTVRLTPDHLQPRTSGGRAARVPMWESGFRRCNSLIFVTNNFDQQIALSHRSSFGVAGSVWFNLGSSTIAANGGGGRLLDVSVPFVMQWEPVGGLIWTTGTLAIETVRVS